MKMKSLWGNNVIFTLRSKGIFVTRKNWYLIDKALSIFINFLTSFSFINSFLYFNRKFIQVVISPKVRIRFQLLEQLNWSNMDGSLNLTHRLSFISDLRCRIIGRGHSCHCLFKHRDYFFIVRNLSNPKNWRSPQEIYRFTEWIILYSLVWFVTSFPIKGKNTVLNKSLFCEFLLQFLVKWNNLNNLIQ